MSQPPQTSFRLKILAENLDFTFWPKVLARATLISLSSPQNQSKVREPTEIRVVPPHTWCEWVGFQCQMSPLTENRRKLRKTQMPDFFCWPSFPPSSCLGNWQYLNCVWYLALEVLRSIWRAIYSEKVKSGATPQKLISNLSESISLISYCLAYERYWSNFLNCNVTNLYFRWWVWQCLFL